MMYYRTPFFRIRVGEYTACTFLMLHDFVEDIIVYAKSKVVGCQTVSPITSNPRNVVPKRHFFLGSVRS